jgi:hypothetical protein
MGNLMFYEVGRQISSTEEVKVSCKNFVRKSERERLLEDLDVGGKIIFEMIFVVLRMGSSRRIL